MDEQPETTQTPPPIKKALLKWYAEKRVPRDLLCIMVTANQWDAHQIEGSLEETFLTEKEFDAALDVARKIVEDAKASAGKAAAGRRSVRPRILSHEKFLLAMVVTKPSKAEVDAVSTQLSDDSIQPQMQSDILIGFLDTHTIWPAVGTPVKAYLMEEYPLAWARAFPGQLMMLAGGDGEAVKKVG